MGFSCEVLDVMNCMFFFLTRRRRLGMFDTYARERERERERERDLLGTIARAHTCTHRHTRSRARALTPQAPTAAQLLAAQASLLPPAASPPAAHEPDQPKRRQDPGSGKPGPREAATDPQVAAIMAAALVEAHMVCDGC